MCNVSSVAYCQKAAQEHRTTLAKKQKPNKLKSVKSTNKGPRALLTKPRLKATPAGPVQTALTQVNQHSVQSLNKSKC